MGLPAPGSAEELRRFARIQERLAPLFRRVFPYPRAPRTVVVVPSLSLDAEELAKISGVHHYEERMLFMLMLLRMPVRTWYSSRASRSRRQSSIITCTYSRVCRSATLAGG